jgi:hypothetical protein
MTPAVPVLIIAIMRAMPSRATDKNAGGIAASGQNTLPILSSASR